jgi:hypothetical protein
MAGRDIEGGTDDRALRALSHQPAIRAHAER